MATLLSTIYNVFNAWKARKDNPNQVTAAQLGTEDKTTTQTKMAGYVPKGVLPISFAGDCLDIRTTDLPITTWGSWGFTIGSFPAMFGGVDFQSPQRTVNLSQIGTGYLNRTGYIYLTFDGITTGFAYQPDMGVDSANSLRIGTVVCDGSGITSLSFKKTFLLGTTRMMG